MARWWISSALLCVTGCFGQPSAPPSARVTSAPVARIWEPSDEELAAQFRPPSRTCTTPADRSGRGHGTPHEDSFGRAPAVRNLHLTFAGDPARTMVVQWSTDDRTLASEVRYGEAGGVLDRVARGVSFEYRGARHRRQHEVMLCDLEPGRTYEYEAGGEGARSERFRFVTAPSRPEEIRVLVVGDARSNATRWQQISRRALSHAPDVMMFSGDAVIHGSSQGHWDEFFHSARSLFSRIPVVWADGNHEGVSEVLSAQFSLPDDGGLGGQEHWYALTYGPLRMIALNDTTTPLSHLRGPQTEFLRQTLATIDRRRTPFVATLHHQPLYTTSDEHVAYAPTRAAWLPLMDSGHVDLDIAGHVHCYESSYPMRSDRATDPAQGTRFFNYGGAGAALYGFRDIERWVQKRERVHGFAILTVTRTRMRWEAWRADGSLIERIEMTR